MTKTSRNYRIVVDYGVQKRLCQHFGVCDETVRRALRYSGDSNNELHRRIRTEAFKLGGQEITVERIIRQ
jgi:hypothetical protein